MRYENDGLLVTYAGPWPSEKYDFIVPEPLGVVDASVMLKTCAGQPIDKALGVWFLPEVHRQVKEWGRADTQHVLAYLKPIVDARIQFVVTTADGPVTSASELLPELHELPALPEEEPDWYRNLTEIKDAVRVQLDEGDILAIRVANSFTPNQIREFQNFLQFWFEDQGLRVRVLVLPAESLAVIEPAELPDVRSARGKMTRIGSTWVHGWVTEAQARVQAGAMQQEQLDLARAGLKESKTAPVEWWNDDERLEEPPAEVA